MPFTGGSTLTEALFTTHKLCRAVNPDIVTLCHSLVKTASALGNVIGIVVQKHELLSRQGGKTPGATSLDQDKSDFSTALSVCARAFMSVLIGASKLTDGEDKRLPSLVICELVETFKVALESIENAARETAAMVILQPPIVDKGKSKIPVNRARESVAARAIAHLLIGFLGLLDKTNDLHQRLFDGFVFVLLERAGRRLYYCTFGQHRSTTMERNIVPTPEPQTPSEAAKVKVGKLAIRLEVRALILILERAMGLAPNHMNPQNNRTTKVPNRLVRTLSTKNLPITSRARLSPIAKDRLQRTLITCMYGNEVEDEFLDVLTKPVPAVRLGSLQNVAKVEEEAVEEWYKQELWRLVGWEVLARENGW